MAEGTYLSTLQRKSLECEHTGVFRFERPFGFSSSPGQWFRLTLDTSDGPQTETFSDAAAPDELEIVLATRLTGSPFKDALALLEPGTTVTLGGPGGTALVPQGATRVAFLLGSVGIAPGRAIIRDRVRRADDAAKISLFYAIEHDTCILFGNEFEDYAARLPWFELIPVVHEPSDRWGGEVGLISADVVRRHLDPGEGWHFLVAGPPEMVEPMRKVLDDLGVGDDRASFELFAGYR